METIRLIFDFILIKFLIFQLENLAFVYKLLHLLANYILIFIALGMSLYFYFFLYKVWLTMTN